MNDVELLLYNQMENIPSDYNNGINFEYMTSRIDNKSPQKFAEDVFDQIFDEREGRS